MHYFYDREDMHYLTDYEFTLFFKHQTVTIELLQEILENGKIYKNEYVDGGSLTLLQTGKIKERIQYLKTRSCIIS